MYQRKTEKKVKRIKLTLPWKLACLTWGILLSLATGSVAASANILSLPTPTVRGHKPTVTAGQMVLEDKNHNGIPDVGEVVSVDVSHPFKSTDPDGDVVSNVYNWKVDNSKVSTKESYTIKASDVNKILTLEVTPYTDIATTEPSVGDVVIVSDLQTADEYFQHCIPSGERWYYSERWRFYLYPCGYKNAQRPAETDITVERFSSTDKDGITRNISSFQAWVSETYGAGIYVFADNENVPRSFPFTLVADTVLKIKDGTIRRLRTSCVFSEYGAPYNKATCTVIRKL
ncbi:hypothetical protein CJP72_10225 [Citrobacter sp. NCU1]|uniref:hypothetical protein n=1 Tax=Citrobacter sp. NCU1 TaxID=2026683 RepID=UPI001390881C|nr:hypothetical protein [Citrobacter sp. NCU1]NDO81127.1 hypothetical protein [Citrobacter sp. NCU1]